MIHKLYSRRAIIASASAAALSAACATSDDPGRAPIESGLADADGPYIDWSAADYFNAHWVSRQRGETSSASIRTGERFSVGGAALSPPLVVTLRAPARPSPSEIATRGEPVFVMADTHGEFEIMAALLRTQGVIDASLRWSFGRGRVVILGDMLDRGERQIEVLWLLYELERQAARAGGAVHVLIGNHEAMVLRGDLRYLHAAYPRAASALGANSYAALLVENTVLGQWLRTKPAVMRIGDDLFMHGGFSRALLDANLSLDDINMLMRGALADNAPPLAEGSPAALVMGRLGPLWYRGYFAAQTDFPIASAADIDATLERYGAHRIFVGHTIVETVRALHNGRVIAVQVYPHRDASGAAVMEGVVIEHGRARRALIDGRRDSIPLG